MDTVHIIGLYMLNDIDISFEIVLTYAEMWMSGGGKIIDRTLSLTALTRKESCLELYGQLRLYFKRLDNRYHTIVFVLINV